MKIQRTFTANGDRYHFDFHECTVPKGWAQIDTSQDAWYFGIWANPTTLQITTYMEGDVTRKSAETQDEFREELRSLKQWHIDQGELFLGADCGIGQAGEKVTAAFNKLGLGDLFHGWEAALCK